MELGLLPKLTSNHRINPNRKYHLARDEGGLVYLELYKYFAD